MAAYFFDTSALVKYYHVELGSDRVNAIFAEPDRVVRASSLGVLEAQSVFAMKVRSAELKRGVAGLFRARLMLDIAAGSLETELSAIGRAVPAREWAKVPADYFANLDHYLYGAPKTWGVRKKK